MEHVALDLEAGLFHHAPRREVGRQGEADEVGQAEPLEGDSKDLPRHLRGQPPIPVIGRERVGKLYLFVAADAGVPQAGATHEPAVGSIRERPDPVPVPVVEVVAQVSGGLLVGAEAAEGRLTLGSWCMRRISPKCSSRRRSARSRSVRNVSVRAIVGDLAQHVSGQDATKVQRTRRLLAPAAR